MQRLLYVSTQKRTKDLPGMTTVTLDVDGKLTELGVVKQDSGSNEFKAFRANGQSFGVYATKKQAGGTLKKLHDGEAAHDVMLVSDAPVQEVTKPVKVIEVPEPVDTDEPEDEDEFGDDETNAPDEIDEDWLDPADESEEDLLEIPAFLRRTVGLAEEM